MRDLKMAGFFTGLVLIAVGTIALFLSPEVMPQWWQNRWGVPAVRVIGVPAELNHPAVQSQIWKGRKVGRHEVGELQMKQIPTREEAAWADDRVDARAQYHARMAGLAFVGLILALLCFPWRGMIQDYSRITTSKGNDSTPTAEEPEAPTEKDEKPEEDKPVADPPPSAPIATPPVSAVPINPPPPVEKIVVRREVVEKVSESGDGITILWTEDTPAGGHREWRLDIRGRLNNLKCVRAFFDFFENGAVRGRKADLEFSPTVGPGPEVREEK